MIFSYLLNMQSHPSWVCGLKPYISVVPWQNAKSHPSWVCGLKLTFLFVMGIDFVSHPSWVCGLKQSKSGTLEFTLSHTLRGCVDWNSIGSEETAGNVCHTLRGCVDWNLHVTVCNLWSRVTPFVGVWIETSWVTGYDENFLSHPSWVCGLKHDKRQARIYH